ncbi:hypothetical protein DB346_08450 [Verrucomicrobia bacterium LW23]|nr:hypothetical protein DB346_08450 [Verrucomicrobia bacterium LW23]
MSKGKTSKVAAAAEAAPVSSPVVVEVSSSAGRLPEPHPLEDPPTILTGMTVATPEVAPEEAARAAEAERRRQYTAGWRPRLVEAYDAASRHPAKAGRWAKLELLVKAQGKDLDAIVADQGPRCEAVHAGRPQAALYLLIIRIKQQAGLKPSKADSDNYDDATAAGV